MDYTSLGLGGVPRAGVLYDESVQGSPRPDSGQFTELGLSGTPRPVQDFDPKGSGDIPPRPDGDYTELSLSGTPGVIRDFTAKAHSRGIFGSVSLEFTPMATLYRAPRYTVATDLVLSIKPVNAVITRAHANIVTGSTSLQLRAQATQLHYHREGDEHNFQGNSSIEIVSFGHMQYRTWRRISGTTSVGMVPDAQLVYTPAPMRNHHVSGRARVSLTPAAADLQYTEIGIAYSVAGSTAITFGFSGRVTVTRETTYITHGNVSLSFRPQATMEKTTGAPVSYHIAGNVSVALIPQATMGLVVGLIKQYAVLGDVTFGVVPKARVTVRRAPILDVAAQGRRRFIRIVR